MAKTQQSAKSEVRLQRIRDERDEHVRLKTKYNIRIAVCVVALLAVFGLTMVLDRMGVIQDAYAWMIGLMLVIEIPIVVIAFFANNNARREKRIIAQLDRDLYKRMAKENRRNS